MCLVAQVFTGIGGLRIKSGDRAPEDWYQEQGTDTEEYKAKQAVSCVRAPAGPARGHSDPDARASSRRQAIEAKKYRQERMGVNDFENVYPGLFALWGSYLCLAFGGDATTHAIIGIVFGAARVSHTICYACGLSVPRTLSYVVGQLAMLGLLIHGVIAAF